MLVDFDTLKTLPRRQVVNGLAEALKTGIIGDPQLFALFECEHPEDNIEQIVYRSLKFKKKIVEQDEREGSVRACLNFGHTIGHGIEAVRWACPPVPGPTRRRSWPTCSMTKRPAATISRSSSAPASAVGAPTVCP